MMGFLESWEPPPLAFSGIACSESGLFSVVRKRNHGLTPVSISSGPLVCGLLSARLPLRDSESGLLSVQMTVN